VTFFIFNPSICLIFAVFGIGPVSLLCSAAGSRMAIFRAQAPEDSGVYSKHVGAAVVWAPSTPQHGRLRVLTGGGGNMRTTPPSRETCENTPQRVPRVRRVAAQAEPPEPQRPRGPGRDPSRPKQQARDERHGVMSFRRAGGADRSLILRPRRASSSAFDCNHRRRMLLQDKKVGCRFSSSSLPAPPACG
jgi:hypothetical protein